MAKFGTLKTKILQKLTEAYASGKKDEIKDTLKLMKENKDFLNMYLFYEEIENKYIGDKETAEIFLEEIEPLLKKQATWISKFTKEFDNKVGDVPVTENVIYTYLDVLTEAETLKNIERKMEARKKLAEHLVTKKETPELVESFSPNENLLHTVLTNNFNVLYSNTLNEEEKKELTTLLSMPEKELEESFKTLQEEVTEKLNGMLVVEADEAKPKLTQAMEEAKSMKPTKFNYYKLQQLKKGL